jgi:hypothetical protein
MFFLASLIVVPAATAEKFLGFAPEGAEKVEKSDPNSEPVAATNERPARNSSSIGGVVVIGGGVDYFSARLGLIWRHNPYVSTDFYGNYLNRRQTDIFEERYGPDVAFVLRVPNPTMVTPYLGLGLGYDIWRREYRELPLDESAGITGAAFGGIVINLTKYIGMQIERRQHRYLTNSPLAFDDAKRFEPKRSFTTSIGFGIYL